VRLARPALVAVLATGCLSKPRFECEVASIGGQIQGGIGMGGGSEQEKVDCGDRAIVVGIGIAMTVMSTSRRTVVTAAARCATISNRDGAYTTGPIEEQAAIGGSADVDGGPFVADCPGGRVTVGIAAHRVGQQGVFNSVAIACATLDPSGAPSTDAISIPVLGTGDDPRGDDASCASRHVVRGMESTSGAELDQLRLSCAPAICRLSPEPAGP
jgi:hypothetical protein